MPWQLGLIIILMDLIFTIDGAAKVSDWCTFSETTASTVNTY
ncbi:uncharacterized protein METZ01_LOCUS402629 [marine metagenome]|uniref:Uncharacterized protein n=1 Tax=marine metagenome TaxID=408172 RepID=A0A382VUR4_9ZZZZ